MDNKEFGNQLEKRTKNFALEIIRLSKGIAFSTENKVLKNQITKSATSVGANYREANRSRSKADFYHKIKICESEASETIYWLELINELKLSEPEFISEVAKEANEILAIFSSISNKLKQ